jgi:hypothetical protein
MAPLAASRLGREMVTGVAAAEGAATAESSRRPYTPSWLDALVGQIERLPGPTWLAYLLLAGAALSFVTLEAALSSRGLFGQDPIYFGYAFFHWYPLAVYHYLSRGAMASWDAFRPATDCTAAEAARWRLELSTTPARPVALLYVVGAAGYLAVMVAATAGFDLIGHQPVFVLLRVLSEAFWVAPLSWTLTYLLFRQLRLVSELHRSVVRVDLLQPAPLQAMAKLTARSALVALALQVLIVVAPLPNLSDSVRLTMSLMVLPFMLMSIAVFVLPLRGMQALLVAEKVRREAAVNARLEAALATLHHVVDEEAVPSRDAEAARLSQTRIDALNKAVATLLQERDFVHRLSTWPWDTSTLRAVLSAVALPIVLFLLTRVAERFLL